jgi:hypothetical protein
MLPLLAAAQLRESDKLVAQVPFAFVAGNKTIPAGECIVRLAAPGGNTLLIRNWDAKMGLLMPASQDATKKPASTYALVFHKIGNSYFLSAVKVAGSNTIYRLRQSKAEAEMLSENLKPTEEILLASVK